MGFFEWGGFSPKGDSEAIVRRLKDSSLFNHNREISPPLDDESFIVISLGGRHADSKSSYMEHYLRYLSEERVAFKKDFEDGNTDEGLGNLFSQLLGFTKFKYEIDKEKLSDEISDTVEKMRQNIPEENHFSPYTWHDLMIMVTYISLFKMGKIDADNRKIKSFSSIIKHWENNSKSFSKKKWKN